MIVFIGKCPALANGEGRTFDPCILQIDQFDPSFCGAQPDCKNGFSVDADRFARTPKQTRQLLALAAALR